jgi:hypothetical protein
MTQDSIVQFEVQVVLDACITAILIVLFFSPNDYFVVVIVLIIL